MNNHKHCNIKLDSHIHFYDCWEISLDQLLTTTHKNLSRHTKSSASPDFLPALCLLDTEKDVEPIWQKLQKRTSSEWTKVDIDFEPHSFWFKNRGKTMLVITGRQINTAEGLEVLVIGNTDNITHDMPIKTILRQQSDNRLNIIPWAAGKWLSKRGRLLNQLLETMTPQQFVLGDNAGRPWLWKQIQQLEYARTHNIPVLCGSDPLPLQQHYLKSGTYGNLIITNLDLEKPWKSIIQAIYEQPQTKKFGRLSSLSSFIVNQLKLRL